MAKTQLFSDDLGPGGWRSGWKGGCHDVEGVAWRAAWERDKRYVNAALAEYVADLKYGVLEELGKRHKEAKQDGEIYRVVDPEAELADLSDGIKRREFAQAIEEHPAVQPLPQGQAEVTSPDGQTVVATVTESGEVYGPDGLLWKGHTKCQKNKLARKAERLRVRAEVGVTEEQAHEVLERTKLVLGRAKGEPPTAAEAAFDATADHEPAAESVVDESPVVFDHVNLDELAASMDAKAFVRKSASAVNGN
jgi:hypothetical protein